MRTWIKAKPNSKTPKNQSKSIIWIKAYPNSKTQKKSIRIYHSFPKSIHLSTTPNFRSIGQSKAKSKSSQAKSECSKFRKQRRNTEKYSSNRNHLSLANSHLSSPQNSDRRPNLPPRRQNLVHRHPYSSLPTLHPPPIVAPKPTQIANPPKITNCDHHRPTDYPLWHHLMTQTQTHPTHFRETLFIVFASLCRETQKFLQWVFF